MARRSTLFLFANGACCNDYFDDRERRIILNYMNQVYRFVQANDASYLSPYAGIGVWNEAHDVKYFFVTDPKLLRFLIAELGGIDEHI